ncbi:MAG: alpha-amylase family glycosyl hydrolase, partial [Pseudoflavonifractor sp.]
MWADEALLYQIYPLGFCGAPRENDGILVPRIRKLEGWISHLQRLGVDGLVLNPVFQSDRHGYDTRDFRVLDCRLGSNEDFRAVSAALHGAGIRLLLDGVFNHVGRGFWAFQDLLKNR